MAKNKKIRNLDKTLKRFNNGCSFFQQAIEFWKCGSLPEYESKSSLAAREIIGSLEIALKVYLNSICHEKRSLEDKAQFRKNPTFDDLMTMMDTYADPKLDVEITRLLYEYRLLRNLAEHDEAIPPSENLYEATTTIRQIILTYLPVKEEQLKTINVPEEWGHKLDSSSHRRNEGDIFIPYYMPYRGTSVFTGREKELEYLHQYLKQNDQGIVIAIRGIGGIGKTELAIQYVEHYSSAYQGGICWLEAREQDIGSQIKDFAEDYLHLGPFEKWGRDLEGIIKYCWTHWEKQGDILVIIDDVNNYRQIKPYLPPPPSPHTISRFKTLITTRFRLADSKSFKTFPIEELAEEQALEMLRRAIGEKRLSKEIEATKAICKGLGHLPLAIHLVGLYLQDRPDFSLSRMLRRLKGNGLDDRALKIDKTDPTWTERIERGVQAAFDLSWRELSDDAKILSYYLSLFALYPFRWSLVKSVTTMQDEELDEARFELTRLHLLKNMVSAQNGQGKEGNSFRLHELIREFFQKRLTETAHENVLKRKFVEAMLTIAKAMTAIAKQSYFAPIHNWNLDLSLVFSKLKEQSDHIMAFSEVIPHLEETAKYLTPYFRDEDCVEYFTFLGNFYREQVAYEQAEFWYQKCFEITKQRFDSKHLDIATSLNNLADIYYRQGRYHEAESSCKKALEMRQGLLSGQDHLAIAENLNALGNFYGQQHQYNDAEPKLIQALEIRQRLLGEESLDVAKSLTDIGKLYSSKYQWKLTEQSLKRLREKPIPQKILRDLAVLKNIEFTSKKAFLTAIRKQIRYKQCEKYQKLILKYAPDDRAKPFLTKALEIRRKILGEENLLVTQNLNNLANFHNHRERPDKAEILYKQALKIRKGLFGEEHPLIAEIFNNLGNLYFGKGEDYYNEAELSYCYALEMRERFLGEDHLNVADTCKSLAYFYKYQALDEKAWPLYRKALTIYKQSLEAGHYKLEGCRKQVWNFLKKTHRNNTIDLNELLKDPSVQPIIDEIEPMIEQLIKEKDSVKVESDF